MCSIFFLSFCQLLSIRFYNISVPNGTNVPKKLFFLFFLFFILVFIIDSEVSKILCVTSREILLIDWDYLKLSKYFRKIFLDSDVQINEQWSLQILVGKKLNDNQTSSVSGNKIVYKKDRLESRKHSNRLYLFFIIFHLIVESDYFVIYHRFSSVILTIFIRF